MNKAYLVVVLMGAVIFAIGCTNKEGGSDLDIITPTDSTQSRDYHKQLPENQDSGPIAHN